MLLGDRLLAYIGLDLRQLLLVSRRPTLFYFSILFIHKGKVSMSYEKLAGKIYNILLCLTHPWHYPISKICALAFTPVIARIYMDRLSDSNTNPIEVYLSMPFIDFMALVLYIGREVTEDYHGSE